jgi:hypothetical protein
VSWDLFIYNFPKEAITCRSIPKDWDPPVIGTRENIITRIKHCCPEADFPNPSWDMIDGPGFSIEVNLGDGYGPTNLIKSFALHVRGGDTAAFIIIEMLKYLDLRALDSTMGDFLKLEPEAVEGLHKWREFRNQGIPPAE